MDGRQDHRRGAEAPRQRYELVSDAERGTQIELQEELIRTLRQAGLSTWGGARTAAWVAEQLWRAGWRKHG